MVAPNKPRTLAKLIAILAKNYSADLPKDFTVLDHLLLATIQECAGFNQSVEAYQRLRSAFHDLNELRVSHVNEVVEILDGIPERQFKAKRILQILRFVFETTYSYDLEQMRRKPLRQATKQLSMIHGTNPFIVAGVVQRSLGGHAIAVDEKIASLLRDLQIAEPEESLEQIQAAMEHLVPKNKGLQFSLLVSELACESPKKQKALLKGLLPPASRAKTARSAVPKSPEKKSDRKK